MPTTEAFLSYNAKDQEFARRLCKALRDLGVKVWIDEEHRDSPEPWRRKVAEAISNAAYFIALLGPNGIGDEQEDEISFGMKLRKEGKIGFIPALIPEYNEAEADPFAKMVMSIYTYRDFRQGLEDSDVHALASLIKHDIIPMPIPPSVTPTVAPAGPTSRRILTLSGGSGARTGALAEVLADRLAQSLGKDSCRVLSMERYYTGSFQTRSEAHTNRYGEANFDDPEIIDFDQIVSDVEQLRSGSPIQIPEYDKQDHAISGFEPIQPPSNFVILEGTYLLQDKRIRSVSDATVYVAVEPEIRFANRVWKDVDKFKMRLPEVLTYYFRAVKPAFDQWVDRFRGQAKLALPLKADYVRFDFARNQVPLNYSSAVDKLMTFLGKERLL
jgi:uridine kinase